MLSGKHVIDDKDGVVSRLRDAIHYKPEVPDVEFEEMSKDAPAKETRGNSGEEKATDVKPGTQSVKVEETMKESEKASEKENANDSEEILEDSEKTSVKENVNNDETVKDSVKTSEKENGDDKSIKRKRN